MQFHILAYDATDDDATSRRQAAREAHLATIRDYKSKGNMLMGAALMDENDKMVGSALIVDFISLDAVKEWLNHEPYVQHNVWEEITITRCSVGPSFL